ncbi:hypothetical protein LCL89_06295 [Halobacillus yeomjeoni]|uniref:Uncharacterized protein n=1 Tax=Halobacillus yeomjeoni TaxID=311194 RepID=A0A931HTH2_9BACI|nr:hypothetical protein [Halobacillus yeomjeoni]MBH0228956.1 hypothetical protein [Halobacillus yeomjeoni]MCA0983665.1 hypothetical protein [Halobacillus yeomjeoni]
MAPSPMEDFLYHLKKYMEYTTEMRASYEHLSEHEKKVILESAPHMNGPEELSKNAYAWHDELFERLNISKR